MWPFRSKPIDRTAALNAIRQLAAAGGRIDVRDDENVFVTPGMRAAETLGWCRINLIETYHATIGSITITAEGRRQAS